MRSTSTTLRRRCASCLVVSAIALASACRRIDAHGDAGIADATQPIPAIGGDAARAPHRGLAPSRPADDRRGLAAIRRHRAAYLVRAIAGTGADRAPARSSADVDLPRRSTIAPHRALLRQLMGL